MAKLMTPPSRTRRLTVIAQDPSVRRGGKIVTAKVTIPAESLRDGPFGHRVQVVDYDASLDRYRPPAQLPPESEPDPWEDVDPEKLVANPQFRAWNCYAIVMATLQRFEFALGRRIGWSFGGHQIKVVPHAFADANAFYSKRDESIMFGYFKGRSGKTVYTCLSHEIISHETTHALLDGLRERYMDPSSPDQAGFHEGFADVVALLSVFALNGVVARIIDLAGDGRRPAPDRRIDVAALTKAKLFAGLLALGKEMGSEMGARGKALRVSGELPKSARWYREDPEFEEPHRRGEILVAAVLHAFTDAWLHRLKALRDEPGPAGDARGSLDRDRVVEEGADVARTLLTTAIRALDYAPTVDLKFGDYLAALLTGDREVRPDDWKYQLRARMVDAFEAYGIKPTGDGPRGAWSRASESMVHGGIHLESLQRDPDEVFRFLWDNRTRGELEFDVDAYTKVLTVRPCTRVDPDDGFTLHETVAQYVQLRRLRASELGRVGVTAPRGMPPDAEITLRGGGVLIFDEFGHLKYHVVKPVGGRAKSEQLAADFRSGAYEAGNARVRRFALLHLNRAAGFKARKEDW
jgi:hypothetical protein